MFSYSPGFLGSWFQRLGSSLHAVGSLTAAHGRSKCGPRFQQPQHPACGILAPQPGVEPVSPALQGEFLATGPQGRPWTGVLLTRRGTQEEDAQAATGQRPQGCRERGGQGTWGRSRRMPGRSPTGVSGSLDLSTPWLWT